VETVQILVHAGPSPQLPDRRAAGSPRATADLTLHHRLESRSPRQPRRRLLARLGVFAAGFSLEAAETVCGDHAVPMVLDGIASPVDKSLVRTDDPLHGQPRFTMLQVVRDFALEQLDAMGGGATQAGARRLLPRRRHRGRADAAA
jgi:predicted ATPase